VTVDQVQLWTATLAEPLAVIVFGTILVVQLRGLRRELTDVVRQELREIKAALHEQARELRHVLMQLRSMDC